MGTEKKTLPSIAAAAGQILTGLIERELGDTLGEHPTRLSLTVLYPKHWVGDAPFNAQDGSGAQCLVGITVEDSGFEGEFEED